MGGKLQEGIARLEVAEQKPLEGIAQLDLSTAIIGSMNPDHVRRNVAAAGRGPFPESTCAEVRRRFAAVA